jgi:hypothetical protein
MAPESVRQLIHIHKNKVFLRRLYRLEGVKADRSKKNKILNSGTKGQLNMLLHLIRSVVTKDIPIKRDHFDRIKKSKILNFLHRHFAEKDSFKKLLGSAVTQQREILRKINVYHQLLFNMFNHKDFND